MKIKILIVEDEVLVAEEISADLEDYGFEITEIAISSKECFDAIKKEVPNVILMDINIKGNLDGIETAQTINKTHKIPIVYLTANTDSKTISRSLNTFPSAFISKPYTKKDLVVALELAFNKYNEDLITKLVPENKTSFFVKDGSQYSKIDFDTINYIEADGSYSQIITTSKKYTLSTNLAHFQEHLNHPTFIRIHRSYIVNINKVEAFDKNSLTISSKTLPISKSYQKEVLQLFNKL